MLQFTKLFRSWTGDWVPRSSRHRMKKFDRELASLAMTAAMV
jgi:hypothetical protein